MGLLSTSLIDLHLAILLLETSSGVLSGENLVNERRLAVFVGESGAVILGWTLDNSANMGVLWRPKLPVLLFVMPVRIKHITHLEQLKISLQFGSEIRTWKVVPLLTSGSLFALFNTIVSDHLAINCKVQDRRM